MKTHLIALAVLAGSALVASAPAHAEEVVIAGSGGPVTKAHEVSGHTPFKELTGVTVVNDDWDQQFGTLRAQVESGSPKWDVVRLTQESLVAGCDEGLLEPIDWDSIPEKTDYLEAGIHECGVGAAFAAMILTYDGKKITDAPASWADFWNTEKWPGKRGLRFTPVETLEIALMADGVTGAEVYDVLATPEGQDRAFAKRDELKDDILWWKSGAESIQNIASGEVVMTTTWNGRPTLANRENKGFDLRIAWQANPMLELESFAIVKGAKHMEEAKKWIAYSAKAERQAAFAKLVPYGGPNTKINDILEPEVLKDLPTSPDNRKNAVDVNARFWLDNVDALTARFANWAAQ